MTNVTIGEQIYAAGEVWMRRAAAEIFRTGSSLEENTLLQNGDFAVRSVLFSDPEDHFWRGEMSYRAAAEVFARVWLIDGIIPDEVIQLCKREQPKMAFGALSEIDVTTPDRTDALHALFVAGAQKGST